ncbi:hypothetical protein CUZ95_2436 [Enterococcus lactis]|nr:hypothetical protein [Enterococcus lactis]
MNNILNTVYSEKGTATRLLSQFLLFLLCYTRCKKQEK